MVAYDVTSYRYVVEYAADAPHWVATCAAFPTLTGHATFADDAIADIVSQVWAELERLRKLGLPAPEPGVLASTA